MEEKNEQIRPTAKIDYGLILTTAGKTLFIMIIVLALAIVFIFSFFPLWPQRIYYNLGNTPQALRYARMYASRHSDETEADSNYARGLLDVIGLSETLFYETLDKEYADILYDATLEYTSLKGIDERQNKIDSYNLANVAPKLRPYVYSHKCYIYRLNIIAAINSEKEEKYLSPNGLQTLDELIEDPIEMTTEKELRYSYFFAQLSEVFTYNRQASISPSQWDGIADMFEMYLSYAKDPSIWDSADEGKDKDLTKLYLYRIAGVFINSFAGKSGQWDQERWAALSKTEFQGKQILVNDYFIILLKEYIQKENLV